MSFQRSLDQATPLARAPRWRANHPNLTSQTPLALLGKPSPLSADVVNSLRRTGSSYPIVLHMSYPSPQYSSIPYQRPLPHCRNQSSHVSLNVKHFASSAEMGLLKHSPSAKIQENIVRLEGEATSYPARPLHNPLHVLQCGLQLDELYLNSLNAARHYMHVQLYGQMSFSLIRIDLYTHRTLLQSAIQSTSSLSLIFGFLPLLQVLYII
jgi:hypothetical protein